MYRRASAATRMAELIFPGDTNHHGTLFGGKGFSLMDRVAFIAATRHGRVPFVTASCERVDYSAPAHVGNLVDLTAEITRVGKTSLTVEVTMVAEDLLEGTRRLCTRGTFTMVAQPEARDPLFQLPPVVPIEHVATDELVLSDMVLTDQTNHHGNLFGGEAVAHMTMAAFIVASRRSRCVTVLASSNKIDFKSPAPVGSILETRSRITSEGRSSITVETDLWSEKLDSAESKLTASASFVMVAVDSEGKPVAVNSRRTDQFV